MQEYKKWKVEDFPPAQRSEIERYTTWLKIQSGRYSSHGQDQELFDYMQIADQTTVVGEKQVHPFAPFRMHLSALQTVTPAQYFFLGASILTLAVCTYFFGIYVLTALCALCILLYAFHLVTTSYALLKPQGYGATTPIDPSIIASLNAADWPSYTILCPLFREAKIVPQYVKAMLQLDYPKDKLQVLFLLEEDDKETQVAIALLSLPTFCQVLTVPPGSPRTKPRACNYGLMFARGQYCVIFDAEDVPDPLQLKKAVLTFAQHGPEVACVQASLNFYNTRQSLLTRFFTIEYSVWFDMILPSLQRIGVALPLGGTSNHFQTTYLRALGGWDAYNVTEDCDLGMRLSQYGLKTAMLESTTYEEATATLGNWIRQRSRWIKGYMQTYLVQTRSIRTTLKKRSRITTFLSLQWVIGMATAIFFINPLMWVAFFAYLLFRSHVETLYHLLFPAPVLYLGTLCLIFGNLFCLYVAMVACMKRERYELVKWCLLLPLYWLLISVAACKALAQLITKPHYWEKTRHGSHIEGVDPDSSWKEISSKVVALAKEDVAFHSASTQQDMTPVKKQTRSRPLTTITEEMLAMPTVQSAAVSTELKKVKHQATNVKVRDFWLIATIVLACVCSVAATTYYFFQHEILIYGDAISHLRISRGVIDSVTPGVAQLGGVWLPLPHILMLPFIWNDYLWATGLAGSIVGMICFIVAVIFIYLSAKRITGNSVASFLGTLVFILNPSVLYLQSTPMTEPVCWATFSIACYYMLLWIQEEKLLYLLLSCVLIFLATLARYDGWILVAELPLILIIVGKLRRYSYSKVEALLFFALPLSFYGIFLWLVWCQMIFGNPFYFQGGPYSSQTQTASGTLASTNVLKHNLLGSVKIYGIDVVETVGIIIALIALFSLILFLFKRRKALEIIGTLSFLAPLVFYVIALYGGQVALFDKYAKAYFFGAIPISETKHLFNARFGSEMVAPIAIFFAIFAANIILFRNFVKLKRFFSTVLYIALLVVICLQSLILSSNGVIAVVSNTNPPFCVGSYSINVYLAQHYNGGYILQTEYPFHLSEAEAGVHFSNIIWEGSNKYWDQTLKEPGKYVDWIIFTPMDRVDLAIKKNYPNFSKDFVKVASTPWSLALYHKKGLAPLPNREVPEILESEKDFCSIKNYPHSSS